jgi:hypothetical protein
MMQFGGPTIGAVMTGFASSQASATRARDTSGDGDRRDAVNELPSSIGGC